MFVHKMVKNACAEGPISVLEEVGRKAQYEELKEGAWLGPGLALLRKRVRGIVPKNIAMCQEDLFGRRLDAKKIMILARRISVNVKLARWRKALRSTDFTTVRNGTQ